MTHHTITVNGDTLLDAELHDWQRKPPEQLKELITPGANPELWMQAALIVLADAALREQPVHIDVTTGPAGWTMNVAHAAFTAPQPCYDCNIGDTTTQSDGIHH